MYQVAQQQQQQHGLTVDGLSSADVAPFVPTSVHSANDLRLTEQKRTARFGTVFNGEGDMSEIKKEVEMVQQQEQLEASNAAIAELRAAGLQSVQEAADHDSSELTEDSKQPLQDADADAHETDEEWETQTQGIRGELQTTYAITRYLTIDDDLHDWESASFESASLSRPAAAAVSTRSNNNKSKLLHLSVPTTPVANSSMPTTPKRLPKLSSLDIERGKSAGLIISQSLSPSAASSLHTPTSLVAPRTISPSKLSKCAGQKLVSLDLDPPAKASKRIKSKAPLNISVDFAEEKESFGSYPSSIQGTPTATPQPRPLESSLSTPLLPISASILPSLPEPLAAVIEKIDPVVVPTPAAQNFIAAKYVDTADVLTPRRRYQQLAHACDAILPANNTTSIRPLTASASMRDLPIAKIESDLTSSLYRQLTGRSLIASPKLAPAEEPPISPPLSPLTPSSPLSSLDLRSARSNSRPSTGGRMRSNSGASSIASGMGGALSPSSKLKMADTASALIERRKHAKPGHFSTVIGKARMERLQSRKKLRSEFLREVDHHAGHGVSRLTEEENLRLTNHHTNAAAVLAGGGAAPQQPKAFSSAELLAVADIQTSALDEEEEHQAALATARPLSPQKRSHLNPVDSHLSSISNAITALKAVRSTAEPSPAIDASHEFMRTHALHHHVPMPSPPEKILHPRSEAHPIVLADIDQHRQKANAAEMQAQAVPLPSHSKSLQMTSPSSNPSWVAPSLNCIQLTEEIYFSTKTLDGLISDGEGKEALDKHLITIRPASIAEEARKRWLQHNTVEKLKEMILLERRKTLRSKIEADAAASKKREEDRAKARLAKIVREKAAEEALKADVEESLARLERSMRKPKAAKSAADDGDEEEPAQVSNWSKLRNLTLTIVHEADEAGVSVLQKLQERERAAKAKQAAADEEKKRSLAILAGLVVEPAPSLANVVASAATAQNPTKNPLLARIASAGKNGPASAAPARKPVSHFSVHRIPREDKGSLYGPVGEDLSQNDLIPPSSLTAGHILDSSIAASEEQRTADEKKKRQMAEYTAVLARLHTPVTPMEKRLRRLDQPRVNRADVRKIVEETLGAYDPNAKKRFTGIPY